MIIHLITHEAPKNFISRILILLDFSEAADCCLWNPLAKLLKQYFLVYLSPSSFFFLISRQMFYSLNQCHYSYQYSSAFCTLQEEQLFSNGIAYYACSDESHALSPVQSFFVNSSIFILAYWKCLLHIPQPSQRILYRINNLFLNFLLQLDLPVTIFWVNRITENPVIQAKNWKTIFFSLLHCLTAHGLILLFCLWRSCLNELLSFSLEGYTN